MGKLYDKVNDAAREFNAKFGVKLPRKLPKGEPKLSTGRTVDEEVTEADRGTQQSRLKSAEKHIVRR